MARDPAALPDLELPPGDSAGSGPGAARSEWLRWLGVAGLCAVIWGGLALIWPLWEKHRAYEIVAEHFRWDEENKVATVNDEARKPGPGALAELDRKTAKALRILGVRRLIVADCAGITSGAALGDIATLQSVLLSYCTGLTSVAGLPPGVQALSLGSCTGLKSVAGLPAGVQTLSLGGCTGLTSVAGLPAGVQTLSLMGCTGLTSVAGLPVGLRALVLNHCEGLASADGLPAGVQELYLHSCKGLTSVAGLPAGLRELDLSYCTGLERLGELPAGLKEVNLRNTPKLPEAVKAKIRALVKKNGGEVIE